jgi:hypothetical protein
LRSRPEEGTIAVTEPQRLALHAAARAALGSEEGDTLMALTPPANTDMATMQALDRVEERLVALYSAQGAGLRAEIASSALRTRLWTIGIVITAQAAGVGYLTLTLG